MISEVQRLKHVRKNQAEQMMEDHVMVQRSGISGRGAGEPLSSVNSSGMGAAVSEAVGW